MKLLGCAQGQRGQGRPREEVPRVIGSEVTGTKTAVTSPFHHLRFGELRALEQRL